MHSDSSLYWNAVGAVIMWSASFEHFPRNGNGTSLSVRTGIELGDKAKKTTL